MFSAISALLLLGQLDKGIYPDLNDRVRIRVPSWVSVNAPVTVRLDPKHRLMTLYRGFSALSVHPLQGVPSEGLRQSSNRDELLRLLTPLDSDEVKPLLSGAFAVVFGEPPKHEDRDGDGIVNTLDVLLGGKRLCENKAAYASVYRQLGYPGGDVPRTEGVCTDTLVRALRNAGYDLQRGIHEDALAKPKLYPLEKAPDANIDHRRIRMMLPFFRQFFIELKKDEPHLPGDLVLFDTFPNKSGPDHAGIVSDQLGPSGLPLIINNFTDGFVEAEMDLLPAIPVTHRFRVPMGTK